MKLEFLTATALVITATVAAPVQAQQQICVIDNNNNLVCGRPATQRDIEQRNNPQSGPSRRDIVSDIDKIYRDVLGRSPDRNGLRTWTTAVERGRSVNDIRREIANTPEARERINQIYRELLGRDADPGGLQTWTSNLANGWDLSRVRNEIANSDEARRRRGQ